MSRFTEKLRLPSGSRLEMQLGRVEADLSSWDRDEVAVEATTPVELVPAGDGVRLTARGGHGTRLAVVAPRRLELVVADRGSRLSLRGFEGDFDLGTHDGRIEGADLRGVLAVRVERGSARLREVLARLEIVCGRGTVELGLDGIEGPSRIRVDGGRVDVDVPEHLDASFGTSVRRPWQSLTVRADFGAGAPPVDVDVRRGEVRLFRNGVWRGTLRPRGEVRLRNWDDRRRRELRKLVARLQELGSLGRR